MKLIVGLGNPGKEYVNTRHNVGFMVLDNYNKELKWQQKGNAMYAEFTRNNEKIIFLKPLTYMNLSGIAVAKFYNYYKLDSKDILVIHDDLDLPEGTYRLKYNSSAGGHNGIKSIIENLNTQEFSHLKIGIGKNNNNDIKDYVLGRLPKSIVEKINSNFFKEIIDSFIDNGIEKTMNKYN